MSFTANWNVYAGEVPSASKWNQIGESLDQLYADLYTSTIKIENKIPVPSVVASSSGAFDLDLGSIFVRTLNGSNNTLSLSNVDVGQCFMVEIIQDGAGPTWWSGISWVNGSAPAKSANGKKDVYGFRCTGSGAYYGVVVGQNI